MVKPATHPAADRRSRLAVIDCDIHNALPSETALLPYLPARWRRQYELFGLRGRQGAYYPRMVPHAARTDAWPPSGQPPGSDLEFLRGQLLDQYGIDYGILNPLIGVGGQLNLEYSAALARAVNDWQVAEWLEKEPRLRAAIVVPYEDGALGAAEVRRAGEHPGFVQVLVLSRTCEPLGRRKYWPLYEAAVERGLPIGIHFGGTGAGPITGCGWPSYYIEDHVGVAQAMQAQVVSLVCEGVFEVFPSLRVVLIEGGFAWFPALMWRLDAAWRRLKEEVPHLTRAPSEYLRTHFWLTTQPMEEPHRPRHFLDILAQVGVERLMFATDYPHWDFDDPETAFPVPLPEAVRQKILAENARALYRLP